MRTRHGAERSGGHAGGGDRPHECGALAVRSHDTTAPRLSDLGITRDQSSQGQRLAEVPEEAFEQAGSTGRHLGCPRHMALDQMHARLGAPGYVQAGSAIPSMIDASSASSDPTRCQTATRDPGALRQR